MAITRRQQKAQHANEGSKSRYCHLLDDADIALDTPTSLPSILVSWWSLLKGPSVKRLEMYVRRLRILGRLVKYAAKCGGIVPPLAVAVVIGTTSALIFTWAWWYVRRNIVWVVYRMIL